MYISVIELEIGVPVANTTPLSLPWSSCKYSHLSFKSLALWLAALEILHFREQEQIFIGVRFVYEQIIDTQVLELQHVVLTARIHQLFELCLLAFLDFFKVFDSTARHTIFFPLLLDG